MSTVREMAMPKGKILPPNKRRMMESDPRKKIPDELLCLVKPDCKQNI